MTWFDKLKLIAHILRWRLTWGRYSLDYRPRRVASPKFITARQAAALIPDGACLFSSGIGGNARCSIFFFAIRHRFKTRGRPRKLTWINGGAQGSRGRVPGTVEDLGVPGLMDTYIAAHLETAKAQLRLAQAGQLALYTLPQGIIALLLNEQAKGRPWLHSKVGLGTFLDPAAGGGSGVVPSGPERFIASDGQILSYTMPQPDFALFNAPYADAEGNIYFHHAATLTENIPSICSVRRHHGQVLATVAAIIPKDADRISVPARFVDHIVVNPYSEQTASVLQRRYWPVFTPESTEAIRPAIERLKFINTFLKITPVRTEIGNLMARLGASLFLQNVPNGGTINIGVGFPEEVARIVVEHDLVKDYTFTTEAGSYGGLPTPGIFFGAAIRPEHLESSTAMFERYHRHLDMAVLGFLQVDSQGNVNVSKRGPSVTDYVGPGGLPDIIHGARRIIFIGAWMHGAEFSLQNDRVRLQKPGIPKFVPQVDEVTFNGQVALQNGKKVFYVTTVGFFQLTPHGLQLMARFPGIDIERDILQQTKARIYLPPGETVPVVHPKIMTAKAFDPKLPPTLRKKVASL